MCFSSPTLNPPSVEGTSLSVCPVLRLRGCYHQDQRYRPPSPLGPVFHDTNPGVVKTPHNRPATPLDAHQPMHSTAPYRTTSPPGEVNLRLAHDTLVARTFLPSWVPASAGSVSETSIDFIASPTAPSRTASPPREFNLRLDHATLAARTFLPSWVYQRPWVPSVKPHSASSPPSSSPPPATSPTSSTQPSAPSPTSSTSPTSMSS